MACTLLFNCELSTNGVALTGDLANSGVRIVGLLLDNGVIILCGVRGEPEWLESDISRKVSPRLLFY